MKKLSLALVAAFALGSTAPAMAADYFPAPPPPMTCMDQVNAHYGASGGHLLAAPLWATHALLCHVFHHDYHYPAPAPIRG